MSFNVNPNWASIDTTAIDAVSVCPYCQETFAHYKSIVENIYSNTYYTVRHIPKTITFTCHNPDCEHVDEDFEFTLKAIVQVIG